LIGSDKDGLMAICEDKVREELKKVIDPELFVNIVDLGLIYVVDLKPHEAGSEGASDGEGAAAAEASAEPAAPVAEPATDSDPPAATDGAKPPAANSDADSAAVDKVDVLIEMTMTSPAWPAGPQLIANSKQVVMAMEEVAAVEVKIVMEPPWTPDCMTDDARDQLGIF
jgi:metal-sulfur cluster biosynthetic enzyme